MKALKARGLILLIAAAMLAGVGCDDDEATTTVATTTTTTPDPLFPGDAIPPFQPFSGSLVSGTAPDGPLVFPSTPTGLQFTDPIGGNLAVVSMRGIFRSSEVAMVPFFDSDTNPHFHIRFARSDSAGTPTLQITAQAPGDGSGACTTSLFIVSRIELRVSEEGELVAVDGSINLIEDWKPENADLRPLEFTYRVPAPT